jgi:hypothetical protein
MRPDARKHGRMKFVNVDGAGVTSSRRIAIRNTAPRVVRKQITINIKEYP